MELKIPRLPEMPWLQGPQRDRWLLPVLVGVIAIFVVLIGLETCSLFCPSFHTTNKPLDSPQHRLAQKLLEDLQQDERFRYLSALPSPTDPKGVVVTGEVDYAEDIDALKKRLDEMHLAYPVEVRVEPLRQ